MSDRKWPLLLLLFSWCPLSGQGAPSSPETGDKPAGSSQPPALQAESTPDQPPAEPERPFFIREIRVNGAKQIPGVDVEEAVIPYLGPGRTSADLDQARQALEKLYRDKGYQTVAVEIPQQSGRRGIFVLQVQEGKVGRLRVHGSRYFSLAEIRRKAPSMAEGKVPNFNDVTRDIIGLNQLSDRRVTPELRQGLEPGTVDIDLNVKDTLPLHGSLELNNRYSANTTELRLNGAISYNNLWQLGHSIGFGFQLAPQNLDDARIFSGFYTIRFPDAPALSLTLRGRKQDSNISTLGGVSVVSPGESFGGALGVTLPGTENFYHSIQFGIDYNHFKEDTIVGTTVSRTPISYYPVSIAYNASLVGKGRLTELETTANFHFRGMGSGEDQFQSKRYGADGSYIYLRGDLSHTQDLPLGAQLYGKVQGQVASQPLVNSEQFAGGGLGSARGYLEASELGDNAVFGSLEFRTPSLLGWSKRSDSEWRLHAFIDAGFLTVKEALPDQDTRIEFASYGFGSRIKLFDHLNGSLDIGIPIKSLGEIQAGDALYTFRVWADF